MFSQQGRLRIVLFSPRIPGNVGNIARTALAAGAELHLVGPLGFRIDEKSLRRSSVNHWFELKPTIYRDSSHFWETFDFNESTQLIFATKNGESLFGEQKFEQTDVALFFGNEEKGIPEQFWKDSGRELNIVSCRIPTVSVRCLNLSVSVGILAFEVVRQWGGIHMNDELKRSGEF